MLKLKADELAMLEGKQGKATQKAMELLVKYAEGLGAEDFVDTNNVTIIPGSVSRCLNCAGNLFPQWILMKLLPAFLLDSDERVVVDKVKAFTTTNATWRDQKLSRYSKREQGPL